MPKVAGTSEMAKSDFAGVHWVQASDTQAFEPVTAYVLLDDCTGTGSLPVNTFVSQNREAVVLEAPHRGPTRHEGAATSLASLWQCVQRRATDLSVNASLGRTSLLAHFSSSATIHTHARH